MPARTNIIKQTLRGISKAQKDYECWSECWLWEAPEYMITTYIAKEIATASHYYVTLEQVPKKAGRIGQGKVSGPMRRKFEKGRFDVVVWDEDTPVIIIEAKNQPNGFSSISGDIDNICSVLKHKNSYKYGLIAYYAGWKETRDKSAEERTSDRVKSIKDGADAYIKDKGRLELRQHLSHPKPQVVEDSAWIGVVLQISKANQ